LSTGRHLYSAGRPSGWALAHILVLYRITGDCKNEPYIRYNLPTYNTVRKLHVSPALYSKQLYGYFTLYIITCSKDRSTARLSQPVRPGRVRFLLEDAGGDRRRLSPLTTGRRIDPGARPTQAGRSFDLQGCCRRRRGRPSISSHVDVDRRRQRPSERRAERSRQRRTTSTPSCRQLPSINRAPRQLQAADTQSNSTAYLYRRTRT